jgi:hypothetical protein
MMDTWLDYFVTSSDSEYRKLDEYVIGSVEVSNSPAIINSKPFTFTARVTIYLRPTVEPAESLWFLPDGRLLSDGRIVKNEYVGVYKGTEFYELEILPSCPSC